MHFCTRCGELIKGKKVDPNLDVAEYMHAHFDIDGNGTALEGVAEADEEGDGQLGKTIEEHDGVEVIPEEEKEEVGDATSFHSAIDENPLEMKNDDYDPLSLEDQDIDHSIQSRSNV